MALPRFLPAVIEVVSPLDFLVICFLAKFSNYTSFLSSTPIDVIISPTSSSISPKT
jgi:hypothetical protein